MPDALSKTVPIWCAIINRLLLNRHDAHVLRTPSTCVSESEHHQISNLLDAFEQNARGLDLDLSPYGSALNKPFRPIWVTRDTILPLEVPIFDDFIPIVLCTASRRVRGAEMSAAGYIQGAGDDSESWAHGLSPPLFWQHKSILMQTSEDDLPDLIADLQIANKVAIVPQYGQARPVKPTSSLFIDKNSNIEHLHRQEKDFVISCATAPNPVLSAKLRTRYLHLQCRADKLGSRDLRKELSKLTAFVTSTHDINHITVTCENGKDLSVGVALALLCLYFDAEGVVSQGDSATRVISKAYIKQRLSWIMVSMPHASPSRATLQSVNDYLFSYHID